MIGKVDADAEFIMGAVFDESLGDEVCVTIVATGVSPRSDAAAALMGGKAARQQVQVPSSNGNSRSSSPNPFLMPTAAAATSAKAEPSEDKPTAAPAAKPAGPAAGVQVPAFLRNMHRKK